MSAAENWQLACLKLGDLQSFNQYLLTRASLTLTATGLTAVAAGTVGRALPDLTGTVPDAPPLLVYFASMLLPLGAWFAISAASLGDRLRDMLLARFQQRDCKPDDVHIELAGEFGRTFERRYRNLKIATNLLSYGWISLVFHAYVVVSFSIPYFRSSFISISRLVFPSAVQPITAWYVCHGMLLTGAVLPVVIAWGRGKSRPIFQ